MSLADTIQCDMNRLRHRGFVLRLKTAGEVMEDLKAFDALHEVKKGASKSGRARGKSYTDAQRWAVIDVVHAELRKGALTKDACAAAGVAYRLYMFWRTKYAITEPQLSGRWKGGES